ncbi:hypothetical protein [Undibacterium oligocarboniphilum]|uniref:Uncharacterized protein n=1 Tax=Undibacterium oligocarboniphilum TaxID=666702 RepID=A0A850QTP6_9BURK|nr:hypothetical protein [Undibacterium oligocarboniphilum]MBC3871730.1 hypothetical protein [Undibacterium oligocarboniphilum]NVO79366.1 hypothetical protein [Undibacterium oligocarboniphilum]
MQLFVENPLAILSNLFLSNPYLKKYMEDVLLYADLKQAKNRFRYVLWKYLSAHVTDQSRVFLGLPERNGLQVCPEVTVEVLMDFMAAVILCTDSNRVWTGSDVCSLMACLNRYYAIIPAESGILTPEYWDWRMQEIYQKSEQALSDLFKEAKGIHHVHKC